MKNKLKRNYLYPVIKEQYEKSDSKKGFEIKLVKNIKIDALKIHNKQLNQNQSFN